MIELIRELCLLNGTSGREDDIRKHILSKIEGYADITVDANGNIIAEKQGKKAAAKKVMVDAHTDEVGVIATAITSDGFIKFTTVGGIETESLVSKRFVFSNGTVGVIGVKHGHLLESAELKKMPSQKSLLIDIGAKDREEAEKYVKPGDTAVFEPNFDIQGDYIISKALDDRIGCAILIKLLQEEAEYGFTATFTMGEEIGLRGAKTATYTVKPDAAIVVESTTAGDIGDAGDTEKVCCLGKGAVIPFMDRATLYDKSVFESAVNTAKELGINAQVKQAVTGGNNAGAIHQELSGVKSLNISVPCRYIHSPSGVVRYSDIQSVYQLTKAMLIKTASGEL